MEIASRFAWRALTAAFCIRGNVPLLHCDPAFEPLREHLGLPVVDPRG